MNRFFAGAVCAGLCLFAGASPESETARILAIQDPAACLRAAEKYLSARPVEDEAFGVDEEGRLVSGDSRLVLLDGLGRQASRLGANRLGAWSVAYAEKAPNSAEELLAVRNAVWADSGNAAFAGESLRKMLASSPSDECVFAEALDGIVFLGDASFVEPLANLAKNRDRSVVAAQTLDRLAEANPFGVMRELNARPELLADRPLLRADFFAKADVGSPAQRQEFERYLLREDVPDSAKEKAVFGLAQRGRVLTPGLFTGPPGLGGDSVSGAVLEKVLAEWRKEDRFARFREAFREVSGVLRDSSRTDE